ncbi:MAG: tyrosine phosphatase family protein [Alphaproteobacteria bacterium]
MKSDAPILICGVDHLNYLHLRRKPTHMISLLADEALAKTPDGLPPERHLKLHVDDIPGPEEGKIHPDRPHVDDLIRFVDRWNGSGPLLVHCFMGISRSAAAAYITLCHFNDHGLERSIARAMRKIGAHLQPNPLLVQHGDEALKRAGRMVRAVEELGRGSGINQNGFAEVPLRHRAD